MLEDLFTKRNIALYKLQKEYDKKPEFAAPRAVSKWDELGPLDLYTITEYPDVEFDEKLLIKHSHTGECVPQFNQVTRNPEDRKFGRVYIRDGSIIEGQFRMIQAKRVIDGYCRVIY